MIQTICVCGAGTMGSGIAQLCAQQGFHTVLYDLRADLLEKALANIGSNLTEQVKRGKLDNAKRDHILGHLSLNTDLTACPADLFIEAIVEKLDEKIKLFRKLQELTGGRSIYASNTSSLPITEMARATEFPDRVAGLHFFNPAPVMKLVEVVKTELTDSAIISELSNFTARLGKTAVICHDSPGFIVNHVARPYYLESLRIMEHQQLEPSVIDELLESSGFRMGPFKLMDLIGNDINYAVSCSVYEALGKPDRLRPSALQQRLVENGQLGKKSGSGYYQY